jgi:glycosyltransferase involved in cell wall biosynthesis
MTNIVLLTRDRYRLTKQCLDSLYATTPQNDFRLVVVDDESEDFRTRRLVESLSASHNAWNATILSVRHSSHNLGQLKNLGVWWAKKYFGQAEWLCLVDNDCCFLPNWLPIMIKAAEVSESSGFRLWSGQQHPYHHPITSPLIAPSCDDMYLHEYAAIPGTHWFMREATMARYGPLTSNASGVCQGEDVNFGNALQAGGWRLGVVHPFCVVDCGVTNSDGNPQPGAELRTERVKGVLYE